MTDERTLLVVGASAEQVVNLVELLPGYRLAKAPVHTGGKMVLPSLLSPPELVLVYARKDESETMDICRELREDQEYADVPILLVIGRYQVVQGSAVKTMGNATFIIAVLSLLLKGCNPL